ncbi:MAG: hypothetical protein AAB305_05525 [Candidatus Zixiibacteriota bacterium]
MTARVNPEYSERHFSKIFIFSSFQNLELQTALEEKLKKEFVWHDVECVFESWVSFSRDTSEDEALLKLIDSSGCDAILVIGPLESGHSSTYIPKSSYGTTTGTGRVDSFGNIYYSSQSSTREYGGYNVNKPWANFQIDVYDAKTLDVVWTASAQSGGNAFAKWKTVIRSMAGQTVAKLAEQGLIAK